MQKKIVVASIFCLLMLSGVFLGVANAALPTGQCNLVAEEPAYNRDTTLAGTTNSYFITSFDVVPAGTWDVATGVDYLGWCIEKDVTMELGVSHWVTLMYSTDAGVTSLPGDLGTANWNAINYVLNHKQGFVIEVNVVIWYFMNGYTPLNGFTDNEQAMIDGVTANPNFVPAAGQVVAVICARYGTDILYQNSIIELQMPSQGGGLTPGFWKNNAINWQACNWVGFTPSETLSAAGFTGATTVNLGTTSLLTALQFQGGKGIAGGEQILLRAAVAALLNAANTQIGYPLTTAQVLSQVNAALASQNRDTMLTLASTLDGYNNLGFDLAINGKI